MALARWDVVIREIRNRPHEIGAEIGIWKGITTEAILKRLPDIKKYYCVDPWELYEDQLRTLRINSTERIISHNKIFRQFKKRVNRWKDKVVILRHMSMDALQYVPDKSLDWVFIDANHSYEYVKPDILGWSEKVKPGGMILGHDYEDPHTTKVREVEWGVKKAVNEIFTDFQVDTNVWYTVKE